MLSFACEMCGELGDHVCREELVAYIRSLDEDSPELEGMFKIYRQLQEATDE